jgi:hypothetical protein
MKRILLFTLAAAMGIACLAQQRVLLPPTLKNLSVERQTPQLESGPQSHAPLPPQDMIWPPEETLIGTSFFDLQSNSGMQNRIYVFDDGTIGATFTFGNLYANFDDRGTGYNYFNGDEWFDPPTLRIESQRTGWPAYAPFGEDGEIVVSHLAGAVDEGLLFNKRDEKGTGDWNEFLFQGPVGFEPLAWPRITTAGIDHSIIHLFTLTLPSANGGTPYMGQDGALLYSRSADGGTTWDPQNLLFDDLNVDNYVAFDGDTYEIQAQDDNVAILIGEPWIDLILLKSTDGGDTWNNTLIWENPYPMWTTGTVTDTFYCVDGAHSLTFDNEGMVHIAFGINRALSVDGTAQSWFPFVDGVGYWNESMPVFSNNINALNPYGHPDSELIEDVNLIGWTQDVDGDGEITFVGNGIDNIGTYQLGLSSMPQILVDESNWVFIVWSSVTETYDNSQKNFRHIWCRASSDGGSNWSGFHDLTEDFLHLFDECVWPAIAANSDENFYLIYQYDSEPGLAVRFDEHGYVENSINFMEVVKLEVGIEDTKNPDAFSVSQNRPNPFADNTRLVVQLETASPLQLVITNMLGQEIFYQDHGIIQPGKTELMIPRGSLVKGVYFYTVRAGDRTVTRKMIVE